MVYRIETTDGTVVRKRATRPYKAAWISRVQETGKVLRGSDFTINPKYPVYPQAGSSYLHGALEIRYEAVVAIPIKANFVGEADPKEEI